MLFFDSLLAWRGVAWRGVAWRDWCGVMWYGVVWRGVAQGSTAAGEQREVLVAALDDPTRVYSFRSGWLTRAPNPGPVFAVGDRVQLDVGRWQAGQTVSNPWV